jgi:large subunit ribosomal protein L19e
MIFQKIKTGIFMEARKAKELAARILKVGVGRIYVDPANLSKVNEAMTKDDVRGLIAERVVKKRGSASQSTGRAKMLKEKKQKGRRRGKGKRSGTKKVRTEQRDTWIGKVRAQRRTLRELREKNPAAVKEKGYGVAYKKIKGNFFKGKKYLIEYIEGAKKQ